MIDISELLNKRGEKMDLNMVGLRIKKIRESRGIKAKFVAKKIGLSITRYSQLENGKIPITTERLEMIAPILGVEKSEMDIFFNLKLSETLNGPHQTGTK
jgi:transcriptional regulator with XRE-family HTH domain